MDQTDGGNAAVSNIERRGGRRSRRSSFARSSTRSNNGRWEQVTPKLLEMALKGNIHAIRMCMDRTNPARKERCIDLELRPISGPQDLPIHFQDITAAVAEGRITPSEGESLGL